MRFKGLLRARSGRLSGAAATEFLRTGKASGAGSEKLETNPLHLLKVGCHWPTMRIVTAGFGIVAKVSFTAKQRGNRCHQILTGASLYQESLRAASDRGQRKMGRPIDGQNQDEHAGEPEQYLPSCFQPIPDRHVDIEDDQIRLEQHTLIDGGLPIGKMCIRDREWMGRIRAGPVLPGEVNHTVRYGTIDKTML